MFKKLNDSLDKGAIFFSGLCVIHCLLTPILMVSVPVLAGYSFLNDESFHVGLLYLAVPVSILGIGLGLKEHKKYSIGIIALMGVILLVGAVTFGHEWFGHEAETVMTVLGAVAIAIAHVKNLRLQNQMSLAS